jgi:flagellar motility protein MotE (MotC chaperone)
MNTRQISVMAPSALLTLSLLFFGAAPVAAEGDGGGDHGGTGGSGSTAEEDELPEFEGRPPPLPWEIPRSIEKACTKEEIVVLRELRERSEQLDLRSSALDERERGIEDAEQLLVTRLAKIESIRADIVGKLDAERSMILATIREEQSTRRKQIEKEQSARLKKIEEEQAVVLSAIARDQKVKDERVFELAGIVATMKSKPAAAMLAGMDETVVLQVLLQLRPKAAGKILAAMPAGVAQRLGDRMTVHKDPRRGPGAGAADGFRSRDDGMNLSPSSSAAPLGAPSEAAVTKPKSN